VVEMHISVWLFIFALVFLVAFDAIADFRVLGFGLRVFLGAFDFLSSLTNRWVAGFGFGLMFAATLFLTHKAILSIDATNGICRYMTSMGIVTESVPQERRYAQALESDILQRCLMSSQDEMMKCSALPILAENRFDEAHVSTMLEGHDYAYLPPELVALRTDMDACR
jgi:hypothetical protein